ncbi:MAG TPA: DnaA/Hda family protein [Planctomicrobium sp.]|nr:DnaA/Hda family protein [Planctomicrobium sp.]
MNAPLRKADSRSFLVLPENQLAVAAVKKLAPGVKRRTVRLVTLIGDPGTGKSHLTRELVRSWELEQPNKKMRVVTASQFASQLAEASNTNTISQFQSRYRNDVDLFVCEDIQMLGARKETQQQLQATIDDLIGSGGVVLLTSTTMPGAVRGLSRRLVNRIHGGLCVAIDLPDIDSRRAFIEHVLSSESFRLTSQQIEQIAKDYAVSPRELLGLIGQLKTEAQVLGRHQKRRASSVAKLIEERTPADEKTLSKLCRLAASRFGVKSTDLKGPRRSQTVSMARQTAMYLARESLKLNYVEIGQYFNRGNHSTVIHACRKIAEQRQSDPDLDLTVQSIRDEFERAR